MQGNPAYGFGVTKACVGAVTLAGLLGKVRSTELPPSFALLFFRKQYVRTGWTWDDIKLEDYVFDTTEPCEGEKKEDHVLPVKVILSWFRVCERVRQLLYSRIPLLITVTGSLSCRIIPACSNVFVSSEGCDALQSHAQSSLTSLHWISHIGLICILHAPLPCSVANHNLLIVFWKVFLY